MARGLFERLGDVGTAAQATIPGFYAWAVTVAPVAWSRGAPLFAKIIACLGLVSLVLAIVLERQLPRYARPVSVWGLVSTSALVWALAPAALLPTRIDAARGVAGMIGWGLFALASAAPALPRDAEPARIVDGAPLRPRTKIPRGDAWFIGAGTLMAIGLQTVGWDVAVPERALLVRLIALASGLAVIGAATQIALGRHARRARPSRRLRVRRSTPAFIVLCVVAAAGLALLLGGR
jgi:hypothetical protein